LDVAGTAVNVVCDKLLHRSYYLSEFFAAESGNPRKLWSKVFLTLETRQEEGTFVEDLLLQIRILLNTEDLVEAI
jgi:hypothetical protein